MGAVASLGARLGIGVVSVGPQSRGISKVHLTVETGGEVVDGVSGGGGQGACPRQAPSPRAHLHPRLVRSGRQVILHLSPGAPKKFFWDLYHALRAITSSV